MTESTLRQVWVHAEDGDECNDPEITVTLKDGRPTGPATCYAHEEECIPLSEWRERHPVNGALPMHEFIVTVSGCSRDDAEQVMAERINHDEDYGFDYEIGWRRP